MFQQLDQRRRRIANIARSLARIQAYFGFRAVLVDVGHRVMARVGVRRFVAGVLPPDRIDPRWRENPHGYAVRFLSEAEIRSLSQTHPELVSPEFVARALDKQDRCLAIFAAERLVWFCWYSQLPTEQGDGPVVSFNSDYVYAYKAYTAVEFRGRRLNALGTACALALLEKEGCKGLLAFGEANNFASRQSALRMGGRLFGSVWQLCAGGRCVWLSTRGCRPYGFTFRPPPDSAALTGSHRLGTS